MLKPLLQPNELPVDVIICHHHGAQMLDECLATLYNGTMIPQHVIVVDNASADGSYEMLLEKYPQVDVMRSEINLGFVKGNMLAYNSLTQTPNTYLWLLNNDTLVGETCLQELYNTMETMPEVAASQPKIISIPYEGCFDYAGGAGGYLDAYGFPLARGRLLTTLETDTGQYDQVAEIFWASGATFFVRHSVTCEVELFDESYYAVSEEVDLSWRILLRGYKIICQPKATLRHYGGFTPDKMSAQGMYLRHRNSIMTMLKNYSQASLWRVMPMRILLEFMAIAFALQKGDLRYAYAVVRSAYWLISNMGMIMSQRRYVQKDLRRVSDKAIQHLFYPTSIALTYYLGGVKHFNDLNWADKDKNILSEIITEKVQV